MEELIALLRALGFEIDGTDLSGLADEQLADAETALQAEYESAREARNIDRAEEVITGIETIRTEAEARINAAAEVEDRFAALDQRASAETEPAEVEPEPGAEGEEGAETAEPEGTPAETAEPEGAAAQPVAAAALPAARTESRAVRAAIEEQNRGAAQRARMPQAPAHRQQVPAEQARRPVITAGAALDGFNPGQNINDIGQFAEAIGDRLVAMHRVSQGGGSFPKAVMASLNVEYPEERYLGSDPRVNTRRIEAAVTAARSATPAVIQASGGLCAPVAVSYDLFGVGDDRRPIRDGFVRFGADRGGIRFIAPPTLTDLDGAVAIWTEANDTTPSSPSTKPCLTITCGDEVEELIDAVTKCLKVGNFSRRTFPEQFARWWMLAGVRHAREAETQLWDRAVANSIDVSTTRILGTSRDVPANLDRAATAMRSRHRVPYETVVRVVAPEILIGMWSTDRLRQQPGDDDVQVDRADIEAELRARNIVVTWTPDTGQEFGAQADGVPLDGYPANLEFLAFLEGTHLFLDGGQLDFGMEIRDSTLNATNDVEAFMETFEGEAMPGVESLHITMAVCDSGETAAPTDVTGTICSSGS